MSKTYKMVHDAFMARADALCEDKLSEECNCNLCPCALMCNVLCTCNPDEEIPEVWLVQLGFAKEVGA